MTVVIRDVRVDPMFVKLCRQHPERAKARQWDIVDDLVRRLEAPTPVAMPEPEEIETTHERDWLFISLPEGVTPDEIMREVCGFYGVTPNDILSARRTHKVIEPRHVCFYLSKELTTLSFPAIAKTLGGKDHTTIMSACRSISRKLKFDFALAKSVKSIRARLEGGN